MFTTILVIIMVISILFVGLIPQYNKEKGTKITIRKPLVVLCGSFMILVLSSFIQKVPARSVGIMITPNGVSQEELMTGWHIVMPWNELVMMDKSEWVANLNNPVSTKDGMNMTLVTNISWKIDEKQADWIYTNICGEDEENNGTNTKYKWIEDNILSKTSYSILNMEVMKYTPIEVYSDKKFIIQEEVKKKLTTELKKKNLILISFQITAVQYPKEFADALLNKKLAQEEALKLIEVTKQKEEELKQAKINKDIAIQLAEGEAKALQIKGSSISTNPKIIELEWINKWNGELPTYMLGNNTTSLMNIGK